MNQEQFQPWKFPFFKIFLFGPLTFAILLGVVIGWANDLQLDLSKEGVAYFFGLFADSIFTPTVYIATLSIPLVTIYVAIHRTMQTDKQLRELRVQNTFSNFHQHRSEYISNFARFKFPEHINSKINESLFFLRYKDTYPYNSPTNFNPKASFSWIEEFELATIDLLKLLEITIKEKELAIRLLLYRYFDCRENELRELLLDINFGEGGDNKFIPSSEISLRFSSPTDNETFAVPAQPIAGGFLRLKDYCLLYERFRLMAGEQEYSEVTHTPVFNSVENMILSIDGDFREISTSTSPPRINKGQEKQFREIITEIFGSITLYFGTKTTIK